MSSVLARRAASKESGLPPRTSRTAKLLVTLSLKKRWPSPKPTSQAWDGSGANVVLVHRPDESGEDGNTTWLIAGTKPHVSTIDSSSFTFGTRQSSCPAVLSVTAL